jgi:hypothetical protein
MLRIGIAIAALTVFGALAPGAEIRGKWKGSVNGREGARALYFVFELEGEELTGMMIDAHGENIIHEGRIVGDQLSFTLVYDLSGDKIKRIYRGTLSGDEIQFTSQAENGDNKREFTVRRMQ